MHEISEITKKVIQNVVQLKSSDVKDLRDKWHKEQGEICPILGIKVSSEKVSLDHLHKLKSEEAGIDGKGCCRGAIEFRANAIEGKISNAYKRLGLDKLIELPALLRNLADYLEHNHLQDETIYIHPTEKVPEKKLSKKNYNKLAKLYKTSGAKAKFPEFPSSGKLTKPLEKIFNDFNIEPYN